jgi:excisionase family DNA binding protein
LNDKILTIEQAAARLGCKPATVAKRLQQGIIDGGVPESAIRQYEREMAETVGTPEAAEILDLPRKIVWSEIRRGTLEAEKVGGRWRIPRKALVGWKPPERKPGRPPLYGPDVRARARLLARDHSVAEVVEALDGPSEAIVRRWLDA